MLIPILPAMEEDLNFTAFEVGFLSDRYGRKKIMLFSLVLVMIESLVTIVAGSEVVKPFRWIVVGRVVQGIGAGGPPPIAMALVDDIFTGNERSRHLGILEVFHGVGKVISPIIGALAALVSWYSAFYLYVVVSFYRFFRNICISKL